MLSLHLRLQLESLSLESVPDELFTDFTKLEDLSLAMPQLKKLPNVVDNCKHLLILEYVPFK